MRAQGLPPTPCGPRRAFAGKVADLEDAAGTPRSSLDLYRGTGHATRMDSRTIELDAEAYEALARQKLPGQSFSEVIKSHFGRRATAADLKQVAARLRISEDTLDAIEEQIRARSESPATAADL
jgi:predicted CopG family antitoxin